MLLLVLRYVYALISVYAHGPNNVWDSVSGSAILFACMTLLIEYFIVAVFIFSGLKVSPSETIYVDSNGAPKGYSQESGTLRSNCGKWVAQGGIIGRNRAHRMDRSVRGGRVPK
jgi:hypothetical protein